MRGNRNLYKVYVICIFQVYGAIKLPTPLNVETCRKIGKQGLSIKKLLGLGQAWGSGTTSDVGAVTGHKDWTLFETVQNNFLGIHISHLLFGAISSGWICPLLPPTLDGILWKPYAAALAEAEDGPSASHRH